MKWFKKITQVLTGLLATTSFIGCHKAEEPVCIYGPPPHEEEPNVDTGENNGAVPAYPGDMEALKEANQGGADVPVAIYGPQPDDGAVPAYPGPDGDDDSAKRNDEANSEINELRKVEERAAIRALYGVRPPTFKK